MKKERDFELTLKHYYTGTVIEYGTADTPNPDIQKSIYITLLKKYEHDIPAIKKLAFLSYPPGTPITIAIFQPLKDAV